jgi:hypothetical protein
MRETADLRSAVTREQGRAQRQQCSGKTGSTQHSGTILHRYPSWIDIRIDITHRRTTIAT